MGRREYNSPKSTNNSSVKVINWRGWEEENITLLNQLITLLLRLLTEEVGKKSNAITLLDQEKGALIRELFQVNMIV